jgi:hypothetical protein
LDVARLPDMQEAWRARFSDADTSQSTAATVTPVKADTAVLETSRDAISRAEQVSREAAAVRSRAEELSRRFTADPHATSDPPAAEQAPPTETAAIGQDANAAPATNDQVLAPAGSEFRAVEPAVEVPVKKQAAAADAPVIEEMATVPPMGVTRTPTAPSVRQTAQPPAARRAYVAKPVAAEASTKPEEDPMMPTELRSFGWASQP